MPGILLMYSYMVNGKIYEGRNERTNERTNEVPYHPFFNERNNLLNIFFLDR